MLVQKKDEDKAFPVKQNIIFLPGFFQILKLVLSNKL